MRNFELEVYFSQWEFTAKHHLTASDSQSMTLEELLSLATEEERDNFNKLHLGYTETWGAPDLRQSIAETYRTLSSNNILCFAGAEEGIYAAMRVMLNKDSHAIVVCPNYQAAETLPLEICDVTGVLLREEDNWQLNVDDIASAIKPKTTLVSINVPNNPTGATINPDNLNRLIALCREHDLYLFSDEVYRGIELDEGKRMPNIADVYEKGVSLNVLSKAYGFPGLRIGWIASQDTQLLQQLERYKHFLSICNSAPSERLAMIVLSNREKLIAQNLTRLKNNLVELESFFNDYPELFKWRRPDGGCIAYPKYIGRGSVEDLCKRLVDEKGVLLLPASIYQSELVDTPDGHFRIGFGRDNLTEGLSEFRQFIEENMSSLRE